MGVPSHECLPMPGAGRANAHVAEASWRRVQGRDLGLLVLLGSLWGTAFMFISLGLRSFSPVLFAALRFDISAATLLLLALAMKRGPLVPRGARQWAAVGVAGLL
ncbi:MAG: EamA family transporter, partial [Gemmatimonadales bacterium]